MKHIFRIFVLTMLMPCAGMLVAAKKLSPDQIKRINQFDALMRAKRIDQKKAQAIIHQFKKDKMAKQAQQMQMELQKRLKAQKMHAKPQKKVVAKKRAIKKVAPLKKAPKLTPQQIAARKKKDLADKKAAIAAKKKADAVAKAKADKGRKAKKKADKLGKTKTEKSVYKRDISRYQKLAQDLNQRAEDLKSHIDKGVKQAKENRANMIRLVERAKKHEKSVADQAAGLTDQAYGRSLDALSNYNKAKDSLRKIALYLKEKKFNSAIEQKINVEIKKVYKNFDLIGEALDAAQDLDRKAVQAAFSLGAPDLD